MKIIFLIFPLFLNYLVSAQVQLGIKASELINKNRFITHFNGLGGYALLNLKGYNLQPFIFKERSSSEITDYDADISISSKQSFIGFGFFLKCSNLNHKDFSFKVVSSVANAKTETFVTGYFANWIGGKAYYHCIFDLGCDLQVLHLFESNFNLDIYCIPEIWFYIKSKERISSSFDYKKYYPLDKNILWLKIGIGLTYSLEFDKLTESR